MSKISANRKKDSWENSWNFPFLAAFDVPWKSLDVRANSIVRPTLEIRKPEKRCMLAGTQYFEHDSIHSKWKNSYINQSLSRKKEKNLLYMHSIFINFKLQRLFAIIACIAFIRTRNALKYSLCNLIIKKKMYIKRFRFRIYNLPH